MTPEEQKTLNLQVAKALGWQWWRGEYQGLSGLLHDDDGVRYIFSRQDLHDGDYKWAKCGEPPAEAWKHTYSHFPDYSTDPAASKLIKEHIVAATHEYGSGYDYSSANRDGGPYWAKVDRCNTESFGEFYVRCDGEEAALALAFYMSEQFATTGRRSCGWVDLRWCKRPGSPNDDFAWLLQIRNDDDMKRPVTFSRWAMDVFSLIGEGVYFLKNHPSPVLDE